MKSRIIVTSFLICIFSLFNLTIFAGGFSLEYQLACINAGKQVKKDDLSVKRFRSILNQLSQTFIENKQQIADMSVKANQILKEDGISESLLNIMEGMNQIFYSKVDNQKYSEYIALYLTMRNKGQSHKQAINSIKAALQSFGIK